MRYRSDTQKFKVFGIREVTANSINLRTTRDEPVELGVEIYRDFNTHSYHVTYNKLNRVSYNDANVDRLKDEFDKSSTTRLWITGDYYILVKDLLDLLNRIPTES